MAKPSTSEIEKERKIRLSMTDLEMVLKKLSRKKDTPLLHKYLPRDYYDTAQLDLYKNDISLRLQYMIGASGTRGGYKQTIKIMLGTEDENIIRRESADAITGTAPDLNAVTDAATRKAIKPFLRKRLKHIFTAAIERRYFNMTIGKGREQGVVEIAFDVGEIILPSIGKRFPFAEIEIELKKGNAAAIQTVREMILEMAPSARVTTLSKADEGTRLYKKHALKR